MKIFVIDSKMNVMRGQWAIFGQVLRIFIFIFVKKKFEIFLLLTFTNYVNYIPSI